MAWINKIEMDLRHSGNHGYFSPGIKAPGSVSELPDHTRSEVWSMEAFVLYLGTLLIVSGLQNNDFLLPIYMI